ncbi:MAG TPA: ParB/RepB/Spo0J family partition protein [Candidatus Alectryocaccomicrobium excrementavium]|uniref:ParB/RepB/Spo0J family partition protein n=1 Tax=Candidatus Alectryocaccomicrobium excrementavium TaxID=2840668 RepID=A0A9D1K6Q6_9FIRM|nr:ParB/RepB/Spo0J family partition protein [Candidatus Alectryocaccomicrobium excrementavium]
MNQVPVSRPARPVYRIALSSIRPNPRQPRRAFSEDMIAELAQSIRQFGLLSPLVVRRVAPGEYELIAGERRLRALRLLGAEFADALILNAPNAEAALIALIENLQREQLNAFEEAEAYQRILGEFSMTQEALAGRLGKSPSAVANRLRLLRLSPGLRERILANGLSERHARALLALEDEETRSRALDVAIARKMTVRDFEEYIAQVKRPRKSPHFKMVVRDHRLFVNAVLNTVKDLKSAGVAASAKVVEREDTVDVVVTLPRVRVR